MHHLPNKYIGKLGLTFDQVQGQVGALFRCLQGELTREELLPPQGRPETYRRSKSYCEPVRHDVLAVVPPGTKQVLSLGCGTGATEAVLVRRGIRVVGIPLDAVVGETARAGGLEVTPPSFPEAFALLAGQRFDCILLIDVLPHVPDPPALLAQSGQLLADRGRLVATAPNFDYLGYRKRKAPDKWSGHAADAFPALHVHRTTPRLVADWIRSSGLRLDGLKYVGESRFRWLVTVSGAWTGPYLSRHVVVTAGKQG